MWKALPQPLPKWSHFPIMEVINMLANYTQNIRNPMEHNRASGNHHGQVVY